MGHYSTVIVRHDKDRKSVADVVTAMKEQGLIARARPQRPGPESLCIRVELDEGALVEMPKLEKNLQQQGKRFGLHVALILAVSASDAFLYVHWVSGRVVRALGCGVDEEDGMWTRVDGEPEEWEAEAFEDEQVVGPKGGERSLGRQGDGRIESPRRGDISVPPNAMKYAECAVQFHESPR